MDNQSRASHREADERFKAFMNSASDGFLFLDRDLRIIEANQNWLDRAQVTEDIYGTPIHELFPVLKENGRYEAYHKVIDSGEPIEFDEVVAPSGSDLVYSIKAFKVDDGLGLISRNITERVHAEEHIVFLNELLKAIRDVNQLIVKEKDPLRLITESCRILTSTQGFTTAYIALTDGNRVLHKFGKGDSELVQDVDNILSTKEIPTEYLEWTSEEINIIKCPALEKTSSLLISPLKYHSLNYGVIICQAPIELLDNQVKELFKEVTGDLSYALYALSMEEKFNALFGVSLELTNASTSREVYSAAFKALTDAFHYRRCEILLVEGDKVRDEYLSGFGRRKKYTLDIDGQGLVTRAARTEKTVYVSDVRNAADYIEAVSGINIRSELCVPVKVDGKVRAVINVERQEVDAFTPQEIKLVETLSNYMEAVLSKNKTMESLERSEKNLLKLLHSVPDPVIVVDSESILFVNNTLTELLGYEANELIGAPNTSIFPAEDRERLQSNSLKRLRGDPIESKYELELLSKNLEKIIAEVNSSRIEFYGKPAILGIFRDIRERKKMEEHIEYLYQVLLAIRNVNQLIVTEKNRAKLLQKACDLMVETKGYDYSRIMILDNGEISDVYDTINNLSILDTINEIDAYPCIEKLSRSHVTVFTDPSSSCDGCPLYSGASGYATLGMAIAHNDNIYGYFTAAVPSDMTRDEELSLFKEVVGDIGYALYALDIEKARAKAVASLAESERRYRLFFYNIIGAFASHQVIYDNDDNPIDYVFIEVNDEFEKLTGIPRSGLIGEKVTQVMPSIVSDPANWIGLYGKLASEGGSIEFEDYSEPLNRWYHVKAYSFEKGYFITIFAEITERKKAEEILYAESRLFSKLIDPEKDIVEITSDILEEVTNLTRSEYGYVSVIEQETGENLEYTLTNMMDACNVPDFQARFSKNSNGTYDGLWGHTLNTKQSFYTNNYADFPNKTGLPTGHIPIKNFLSVPVLHGDQLVGQICLTNSIKPYDSKDVEAIERIANIYALAINRMQYEDSLQNSQERLSGFIESAVDGFSLLDHNMRYLMVNDTELKFSGLTKEDYVGKHILDIIPDLEETGRYDGYLKVLETGEPIEYKRAVHIPERNLWFDFQAFKAGDVLGIISKDVSGQVLFEHKLESLHHYAVDSLVTQSLEKLAELTNKALNEILDFEFCEVSMVKDDTVKLLNSSRPGGIYELPLNGPGIVVRAIKSGETQYVPDVRLDPDYVEGGKRDESGKVFKILSELVVPVKVSGETRLILNMERSSVDAFSTQDQRLAEILATHTASAYELIKERELRSAYTQRLESLYLITESLPASTSIDDIAEKIETAVRDIIGFDIGSFGLVKGNVLHHEYLWGVDLSENIILPLNGTCVTVRSVQTGETQFIRDTKQESEYYTPDESGITRSELCIPVKIAGEVVAVINIESRAVDAFSSQDVSLLSILTEHVGSTIHNLRLLENEREFTKRLESLSRAAASLNTAKSIDELAIETLAIIDEIMEAPYTSFSIIENNTLVAIKSKGAPLIDLALRINGPGITVRVAREKKTIIVNDTRHDPDFVQGSTDSLSELAIPIIVDGESKGVINMESIELGYFDSTHQSLTETLAANVASNMQRIQREEATREAERRAIREQERAEQAIELEEMKTSFIRTATHEIRTPLTSIKGYTQLAQMKIQDADNPELDKYFDAILRNTERLESLSADLLDVQRIESGQLELNKAPTSIHDILNDLKLEMKPILDSRDQTLIISSGDYMLNVDRIRMMQVLVNLVMNASKFSPEGSQIKITIEKERDMARISVCDEGVGIKEEDIPKLFKPFPGIKVKGVKDSTGLGLSISKGLVELHGGEIWVESEGPGKGSKFAFTCPCILGEGDE